MDLNQNKINHNQNYGNTIPGFGAEDLRRGFGIKVLGIVSVQMLVTFLMTYWAMNSIKFQYVILTNIWLFWTAFAVYLVTCIVIVCSRTMARTVPINYCLLGLFTLAMSYIVATTCILYDPVLVEHAAILTVFVTIGLFLYAIYSKEEIGFLYSMIHVFFWASLALFLIYLFSGDKMIYTLYCYVGVLFYGIYLVVDLKMMMGKAKVYGHSVEYSYDDYIVCAMQIYIDIVMLFLEILQAMADKKN